MIYDVSGTELLAVFDAAGENLEAAYDVQGESILTAGSNIDKYSNYTIEMLSYNTPCGQDFAYHDGKLVAATETSDVLRVVNATTGERLGQSISVNIGHCNSMVFSDEYYDQNDTFPLICTTYNGLGYYRVGNSFDNAAKIKGYLLETPPVDTSTVWYGLGFDNGYLYTIGYTSGSYQPSTTNFILLAKYDLQNPVDNGDNTFTLPLLYSKRRSWFECIQGSEVHDGFFWCNSGFTNPGHIYALDLHSCEILLDIPLADYTTLEMEALTWENDYTLIVSSKNQGSNTGMYKITFTDLIPTN